MIPLKVKKLKADAMLPHKSDSNDACFDLYSNDAALIPYNEPCLIDTDIAMEIPTGYAGFIWDRSGLGSKGIHRLAGVIDSSYRGNIRVVLINLCRDTEPYLVQPGDRIAQIFITKVEDFLVLEVDELSDSDRGEKGFGSSGK